MKTTILHLTLGACAVVVLCATASAADTTPAAVRTRALAVIQPLPEKMPGAEQDTRAMISLGRQLYNDKRLSANDSQSCNTCHQVGPGKGGVDNEPTSPGAFGKRGGRNSPTVLNAGFAFTQFWDGRAADLAAQAKGPILNPIEMAMPDEKAVIAKLAAIPEYRDGFKRAFPRDAEPLTYDNLAKAIAAFERRLITRDRVDDFLKGDNKALTADELKGFDLFLTTGCTTCHNGPLIGGNSYQKMGLVNVYQTTDVGRFEVTKDEADRLKFKVPTLRNVALTAPYFHDGKNAALEESVQQMAWLQLGKKLEDADTAAIVAFLRALSDKPAAASATPAL